MKEFNLRLITFEHLLYALALTLALGVRLLNLGAAPLSEAEAGWALQALPGGTLAGPQPAYLLLTRALFTLFNTSTNFLARFWPALAGSLLVLLPLFFRGWLGRSAALVLAFGLALDPGLVTVARLAGSPMPALAFGLLAFALWRARQPLLAGLSGGLALLSGPAVLLGGLGLGLAWGVSRLSGIGPEPGGQSDEDLEPEHSPDNGQPHPAESGNLRTALLSAAAAVLLVGTLFFSVPQGISAWFGALPAFFESWIVPGGTPALRLLAGLALFQPLALLFGLLAAGRAWLRPEEMEETAVRTARFLSVWAVFGLLLALLYPGRQMSDLIWVLLPLWGLAGLELARHLPQAGFNPVSAGQAVLVLVLLGLFWYTLSAVARLDPSIPMDGLRLLVLGGILILGGLATILVALGWSWSLARAGLVWGLVIGVGIYSLAALWGAAHIRHTLPQELWSGSPATGQAGLLRSTLGDLSEWNTGHRRSLDIVVAAASPSLRWALRDFTNVRFVSEPAPDDLPSVVIAPASQQALALAASYRGQDFGWWVYPGWNGALPPDFIRWLTFREAPVLQEQVILWARADTFPGGVLEP